MNFFISIAFLALIAVSCDAQGPPPISTTTAAAAAAAATTTATNPAVINWIKSTGYTGYNSQLADVQKVQYSTNYVYVTSTSIPGTYTVGKPGYSTTYPWADDPYVPVAQSFVVKIPLNPVAATTVTTPVPMGTAAILLNGVSVYNSDDGQTYNNAGVWHRNADFFESYSFDSCLGHASVGGGTVVNGLYHHHVLPVCLSVNGVAANTTTAHSPLLGFALDGFPIYGPYGYTTATSSSSAIKKLTSSYVATTYTSGIRNKFANGTTISSSANYGPSTSTTYQLNTLSTTKTALTSAAYLLDYAYTSGAGDLNAFNGRFQVTPEYPNGIFCYIFTDSYPYLFGPGNFYGTPASTSTSVTVSESTTTYFTYSSSG